MEKSLNWLCFVWWCSTLIFCLLVSAGLIMVCWVWLYCLVEGPAAAYISIPLLPSATLLLFYILRTTVFLKIIVKNTLRK